MGRGCGLTEEYNMALILNPSIILSTVIAQTVNEFIPPGVVLLSLMFFVVVSISINIYTGVKKFRNETKTLKEKESQKQKHSQEFSKLHSKQVGALTQDALQVGTKKSSEFATSHTDFQTSQGSQEVSLPPLGPDDTYVVPNLHIPKNLKRGKSLFDINTIKYYECRNYHPVKTSMFVLTAVVVVFYSLVKGTASVESIFSLGKCEWPQFLAMAVVFILIVVILAISVWVVYGEQRVKKEKNYHFDHEFNYSGGKIVFLVSFGLLVGFFAYLLGIGGGLFLFPMLTLIKLDPFVTSSTVMFLIFLSKIVATILSITSGFLNFGYIGASSVIIVISVLVFLNTLDKVLKQWVPSRAPR